MKKAILLAFLSAAALAQQKVIVAGAQNPVPESCKQQVQITADKLREIDNPGKPWTWVVVCSEQGWNLIVKTAQQELGTCCAFSILEKGFTYINGARLTNPLPRLSPGYIIAHEIGHIQTGRTKEDDADKWADRHGYKWGTK